MPSVGDKAVRPLTVVLGAEASAVIRSVAEANGLRPNDIANLAVMTGLENVKPLRARFVEWLEQSDAHAKAVYAAEDSLGQMGQEFSRIKDAQRYVDEVCASAWWRQRFARLGAVEVRGNGEARDAYAKNGKVHLPRWGRKQAVVLHEMAHLVQPDNSKPHGPEYLRLYCDMVGEFMGAQAALALAKALHERKLRIAGAARAYTGSWALA